MTSFSPDCVTAMEMSNYNFTDTQKENLGSLFRIAIVIEIQKIVGAFSPNSGIIVEKCFIYLLICEA